MNKHVCKNTKGKVGYDIPTMDVASVELEGCVAASVQMIPEAGNFEKYEWDEQPETESDDITFLF